MAGDPAAPQPHRRSRARRAAAGSTGSVAGGLAALVGGGVAIGLVVAGLAVPVVATAGAGADAAVEMFEDLPTQLDPAALPIRSTLRFSDGTVMTQFWSENRVVVPLDQMSPYMRDAIIAIEDARFYEHGGADPQGIIRAAINNFTGGSTQGASTLTQQWIKNVLLQQARESGDEEAEEALMTADEARKVREIRLAIAAEETYTKDQILENYLNIALFGGSNYGVEAASQYYFGKPATQLEVEDAALLAGMVQNPSAFEPLQYPEAAQGRRDTVLARMLDLGKIDQAQYDAAVAVPVTTQTRNQKDEVNGCAPAGAAGYFCDYAVQTILRDPAFGADRDERIRTLYRGGVDITTTLQRPRQKAAETTVMDTIDYNDKTKVGATLVSVEPGTGKVVAMAQNRRYTNQPTDQRGYTNINYNVDEAYGGGKGIQPGSNWKPFTLATWLKDGNTLNEFVTAAPRSTTFRQSQFDACGNGLVGEWPVRNSEGRGTGRMSVLEASYASVNTAYASMALQLDLCDIRDTAASMGAHPAVGGQLSDIQASIYPASILGTIEVAPLTMAAAYATFASSGTFCPPRPLESAVDRDGQPIGITVAPCTEPLATDDHTSEEIADTVNYALGQVLTKGTARRVGGPPGFDAAGKTGTTDEMGQTWFTGYTPELSTTAWVGHIERTRDADGDILSLSDERINGNSPRDVYGSTYAAPMWREYMDEALDGVEGSDFGSPDWGLVGPVRAAPPSDGPGSGSNGSGSGSGGGQNQTDDEDDD
ncbi:transglycosylase domain-containing protein [Pseudokineococcus lusitanus]|uniref:transglycosylase domain-containing protein n=1 Tax=Pseudokineococcus lusitanus TaxID=763993 RepID=UPI0011CEBB2D|nr:transglycosylase domain-containing protein [Pseudokineococcus lusitanus]